VNRRAAIAALLTAAPAMAQGNKIKWAEFPDSSVLAGQPMMVVGPRGEITIHLEAVKCLWVTLGNDAIDISAAELFEALKPRAEAPKWNPHATITDRPAGMKP